MRIFREEIFGPVLAVTGFDTLEEAIALGNDTDYGLAAAIWTAALNKAVKGSAPCAPVPCSSTTGTVVT